MPSLDQAGKRTSRRTQHTSVHNLSFPKGQIAKITHPINQQSQHFSTPLPLGAHQASRFEDFVLVVFEFDHALGRMEDCMEVGHSDLFCQYL